MSENKRDELINVNSNDVYDAKHYEEVEDFEEVEEVSATSEEASDERDSSYIKDNDKKKRKPKRGMLKNIALVLIVGVLGGVVGGSTTYYVLREDNKTPITSPNPPTFKGDTEELSATSAFEKVAPAVVIVSTKGVDYKGFIPQEVEGIGTGFIINEEGYILTNCHVVELPDKTIAQEVTVTLSNKKEVKAKVINYDQNQDIAMLKLTDNNIKVPAVVELGDSDALKAGEEVIAIGTPLSKEFSQTVTKGIVSAINRNVETKSGVKLNLIQTDTPINPGNSGGPLVNTKGQVVGINTMKLSGGAEGIGFAIPINEIKSRIDSLSKPILNLGISIREVNEELSKQYDMPEGLYVVSVNQFSPAEKAGIKSGDVIVKFDGKGVKNFEELKKIKESKNPGDTVKVEVVRNKEKLTLDLQLTAE